MEKRRMRRRSSLELASRIGFVVASLVTLVAALTPPADHPLRIFPWEKGDHVLAFVVLAALAATAAPRLSVWLILALLAAYGAAIEVLQALPIVGRDPALTDVGIDTAASAVSLIAIRLSRRYRPALAAVVSTRRELRRPAS
jgi:hypothetical protein